MLSRLIRDELNSTFKKCLGVTGEVGNIQPVSGGSINSCYQISFGGKQFFLKLNKAEAYPGMFMAEASGLKTIAATTKIAVPKVICYGEVSNEQYLILQWIENGSTSPRAQAALGTQLAELHRFSNSFYGLDHNNYMGSLVQKNGRYNSIADFFIEKRLRVQVELALDKGLIDGKMSDQFKQLFDRAGDIIPDEPPALVHGDLWSGNYLISSESIPYLIDPAIAFSHREIDIAMTRLFGGFSSEFYASYQESFPLERGWEKRVSFWNLYPLLIHLNIFGQGYLNNVQGCLKQWI